MKAKSKISNQKFYGLINRVLSKMSAIDDNTNCRRDLSLYMENIFNSFYCDCYTKNECTKRAKWLYDNNKLKSFCIICRKEYIIDFFKFRKDYDIWGCLYSVKVGNQDVIYKWYKLNERFKKEIMN